MIRAVDNIVHRRLRFGYDVGKGFVTGEEEMLQQFDRFGALVHEKISQELRRRAEETRLDVIKSLGEWEESTHTLVRIMYLRGRSTGGGGGGQGPQEGSLVITCGRGVGGPWGIG